MTAPRLISRDTTVVKSALCQSFAELVGPLLDTADSGGLTAREAECKTWSAMIAIGALVLAAVFAAMCRRATEQAVASLGLRMFEVALRLDEDYIATLTTTLGRVRFPWFAFRDRDGLTQTPARSLFPLHETCRSSEVCLEWEAALAADHPFRKSASALGFFTHGAVDLEDNTIERHAVMVGSTIPRDWLYRPPAEIRELMKTTATRDAKTGKPIVYASTDAHALQRFVNATWKSKWKMCNGIRMWCVDRETGETVHLGGEFTWGDCKEVARLFTELQRSGHLPVDGDYGDGVVAQIALVTDGSDWIAEHVLPLFPGAVMSLDPYHVIEQVAAAARAAFPKSAGKVKKIVRRARKALGMRDRRGRTVKRKGPRHKRHRTRRSNPNGSGQRLLDDVLNPLVRTVRRGRKRVRQVIDFVDRNLFRLDHGDLRARGFQIGSGAMESLHRTGSQLRMKLSGCRWTAHVAQAILNLRMLTLSGRWGEYWQQPDLPRRLAAAGCA